MTKKIDPHYFIKGLRLNHPEDGPIEITAGYYLDPTYGRVSNFFYWKVLDTGQENHGYGFPMTKFKSKFNVDDDELEVQD